MFTLLRGSEKRYTETCEYYLSFSLDVQFFFRLNDFFADDDATELAHALTEKHETCLLTYLNLQVSHTDLSTARQSQSG